MNTDLIEHQQLMLTQGLVRNTDPTASVLKSPDNFPTQITKKEDSNDTKFGSGTTKICVNQTNESCANP